jgi:hypothetical protein
MEAHEERLSTSDVAATSVERPVEEEQRFEREAAEPAAAQADAGEPEPAAMRDETAEAPATPARDETAEAAPLLGQADEADLRARWEEIQTRFVDDPRQAVEDADALVAGVMKRMAEGFAQAREQLEGQWSRGEDVGTEDLRVALQRYRSFFQRLLSA